VSPDEPDRPPAPGALAVTDAFDPAAPPAAAPTAEDERASTIRRQNRVAALGGVALLVVLAFGAGLAIGRATAPGATGTGAVGASSPPGAASPVAGSPAPTPPVADLPSEGNRLGRVDAKVVVEYWADYQCPFCARFAQNVIPALQSRIADGEIALVHRDYAFLGDESLDAAIAVHCAGRQDRYWPMHDAVYAGQQGENQGAFARPRLLQIGASVGLEAAAFSACLDERAPLVEVLADTAAGVRGGIKSTPTIDVNGQRFLGVPDVARLLATIDAAAAGATPAPLPTRAPSPDPWTGTPTSGREAGGGAAPVTVELWMDYQALGSAVVAQQLGPELRSRIATGTVRVVLRDLATQGEESVLGGVTVRCVARQDGPVWFTHDVLAVSAQGAGSGLYTPRTILRFASRIGLDVEAMNTCLDDPSVAADVRAETATGTTEGLTSAPAIVVRAGGREVARFSGTLEVPAILKAVDAAG
jgi:protein-disulfide isomerase